MNSSIDQKQNLSEKRINPRYKTDFPAEVVISTGELIHAKVTNVSISGLQLTGSDALPYQLFADRHQLTTQRAILMVHFYVPTQTSSNAKVSVECESVYIRRPNKKQSIAGCAFRDFQQDTEENLASYITHFGVPI